MNGIGTATQATFINRNITIPLPQFLAGDELDAVWIAVRR
ncbi:MAG: hypothetical protein JWO56_3775, partial [Acidobacteria bacterium]|nr:hypothetical protein [Acidobacteriota bacterium]